MGVDVMKRLRPDVMEKSEGPPSESSRKRDEVMHRLVCTLPVEWGSNKLEDLPEGSVVRDDGRNVLLLSVPGALNGVPGSENCPFLANSGCYDSGGDEMGGVKASKAAARVLEESRHACRHKGGLVGLLGRPALYSCENRNMHRSTEDKVHKALEGGDTKKALKDLRDAEFDLHDPYARMFAALSPVLSCSAQMQSKDPSESLEASCAARGQVVPEALSELSGICRKSNGVVSGVAEGTGLESALLHCMGGMPSIGTNDLDHARDGDLCVQGKVDACRALGKELEESVDEFLENEKKSQGGRMFSVPMNLCKQVPPGSVVPFEVALKAAHNSEDCSSTHSKCKEMQRGILKSEDVKPLGDPFNDAISTIGGIVNTLAPLLIPIFL